MDGEELVDGLRPGMVESRDQHLADEDFIAFDDVDGNVDQRRIRSFRLRGHVYLRLAEAVIEIVTEDGVTISGDIRGRIWLSCLGVQKWRELLEGHLLRA